MKDKFSVTVTRSSKVTISKNEAKELVKQYLEDILSDNYYITDIGKHTEEQLAASVILKGL